MNQLIEPQPVVNAPSLWHSIEAEQALAALESDPERGLNAAEIAHRTQIHGQNILPRVRGESPWCMLWRQINNPLIWVLIGSSALAMAVDPQDGLKNGAVILAVVVLNTLIGFIQELKAANEIAALSQMVPELATVTRDGRREQIPAAHLVPGDIVHLASGDKVPADMRLIQVKNLQAEEAALTGESVPTQKALPPVASGAGLGDRLNMAFSGTLVTYGTATGVVTETGARTELGKISQMLSEATDLATPLTVAFEKVAKQLTVAILIAAVVMLGVGTAREMLQAGTEFVPAIQQTLIFAIALAVGAIPEGLPAIVTIALAIGVQRMAARKAIVRKLPSVETLGSTTVICSDKTGTLTRNEMTVQEVWTPAAAYRVTGVGYGPEGELHPSDPNVRDEEGVRSLLLGGVLCNDATVLHQGEQHAISGDPTEAAMVVAAGKLDIAATEARERFPRLDSIPFESENQFMATLHGGTDAATIYMKGAPEVVLRRCDASAELRDRALAKVEELASRGMRVLAVAEKHAQPGVREITGEDAEAGFELLGLQGMIDPPRPEAIESIANCHRAGITVKMITGDHHGTAIAIGRQIGIAKEMDRPVTGVQLAAADDAELLTLAKSSNVFARVAPEHKLRIVKALQHDAQVVSMTGDGVNDAPALKQANIGVAMGITGTAVTKESADIVLTDDNFSSIAAAVEEGRRVYDNLVKSLAFVLPTNLGLALILGSAVAAFPLVEGKLVVPITPVQLLWINLVGAVLLALPLAFEAKEPDIMGRPPRTPGEPILSRFLLVRTTIAAVLMTVACVGLFLYEYQAAKGLGFSESLAQAKAQTMAVTTVIMFQIFYMLNCRSLRDSVFRIGLFSNRTVFYGIGTLLLLQAAFIYAGPFQWLFGTAALSLADIGRAALAGALVLPVMSLEKWINSRRSR